MSFRSPRVLARMTRRTGKVFFSISDIALAPTGGPKLLLYHQVGAGHGYELDVASSMFRRQIEWLMSNRRVVPLEAAVARRSEPDGNGLVVLTFDDGYADMATNAFPVLESERIPFTLYLSTKAVEEQASVSTRARAEPINWSSVQRMLDSGLLTLGSHTHSHVDLRNTPVDRIDEELAMCDELIERRVGIVPRHFAYPWGYWSSEADKLVRTRYKTAVVGATTARFGSVDPWALARVPVQLSDGFQFFKRKATRGLRSEELIRRVLTGYRGP